VQLTPPLAAQLVAAAAAARRPASALTLQDVAVVATAWLPLLPGSSAERNRLLSSAMKAALGDDPVAFDLIKQDGRDFT
jgi:hypothetical protein